jgi:hypothetical protein
VKMKKESQRQLESMVGWKFSAFAPPPATIQRNRCFVAFYRGCCRWPRHRRQTERNSDFGGEACQTLNLGVQARGREALRSFWNGRKRAPTRTFETAASETGNPGIHAAGLGKTAPSFAYY